MTTEIIAIDATPLKCPGCGNEQKFVAVTAPCFYANGVHGFRLRGVTCKVCDITIDLLQADKAQGSPSP